MASLSGRLRCLCVVSDAAQAFRFAEACTGTTASTAGRPRQHHAAATCAPPSGRAPFQASPPTRRASTAAAPLADAARTQRPATQRRGLHATPVASALPAHQVLEMPALSPTMEEGTITEWLVQPGDEIAAGDAIANLETDKAVMSFDTQEDGVVAKILVDAGVAVPVGRPVAVLVESKADVAAFADYAPGAAAATPDTESEASASSSSSSDDAASAGAAARASSGLWAERLGPAARMALALRGLSASDVVATGPRGMLTKADVLAAKAPAEAPQRAPAQQLSAAAPAKPQKAAPAPEPPAQAESTGGAPPGRVQRGVERYTDAPVSGMRRVIAKRLLESKLSIPTIYVAADVRLGPLTALRATLKTAGVRASVNDFVLKGAAKALRAVPAACAGWDAGREEGVRYEDVDISVAVATEGGLITPIVKGADGKSVAEIGAAVRDLAGRARDNKLAPHEYTGGSFTVSNLGMFGVREFCAIINPPQACILAVGGPRAQARLARGGGGGGGGGGVEEESVMTVTLSADARVVGDDTAATFLDSFAFHLENPALLLAP